MEGFRHLCVGDRDAVYVCVHPNCKYKVPLLCEAYKTCCCRNHIHDTERLLRLSDFMDKLSMQLPKGVVELKKALKDRLGLMRRELDNLFKKEQQNVQKLVLELVKRYGKKASTLIRSYKDVEEVTGSDLKRKLEVEPENFPIPPNLTVKINASLVQLGNTLSLFVEQLQQLVPLSQFVGNRQLIQNRIDRARNELVYQHTPAPLRDILQPEFSNLRILVLDDAIKDFSLVNNFTEYTSNSLRILSVKENGLGDDEIRLICQARLPNLTEFKACYNKITDRGAIEVAQANWPNLGYFNLHSNAITQDGAGRLLTRYSAKLFRFDLDYNKIGDGLLRTIEGLNWPIITEVHLAGNPMSKRSAESIQTLFRDRCRVPQEKLFIMTTY